MLYSKSTTKSIVYNISTCRDVVQQIESLQQVHNKSNRWSLAHDLLWTCCAVRAN